MAKRKSRKATSTERTRARQTGVRVKKLRAEQHAAELSESLQALANARARYAAEGHAQTCNDALAQALREAFNPTGREFDLEGFRRCLRDNEIKEPAVDLDRPGAIGRFRMCASIAMRSKIKKGETVVILGKSFGAAIKPAKAKRRGRPRAAA